MSIPTIEQLKFDNYEAEMLAPLRGIELSEMDSLIASYLLDTTALKPRTNTDIREFLRKEKLRRISERSLKAAIRRLRVQHCFPILASLQKPWGYWWCRSVEEMDRYISVVRSRAISELAYLKPIVDHNFPQLAGQLQLPFDLEVNNESNETQPDTRIEEHAQS